MSNHSSSQDPGKQPVSALLGADCNLSPEQLDKGRDLVQQALDKGYGLRGALDGFWRAMVKSMASPPLDGPWRPIETAPVDGTEVDLWRDGERLTNWRFSARRHGWFQEVGYPVATVYLTKPPSHWMPLPPHPADGALGRQDGPSSSPGMTPNSPPKES